jgi:succinate dehydrogenase / fumarate reductase, cytochrome b subunit
MSPQSAPQDMHDTHVGRPLSPHLQIYRPQLTSMMSILHRITGVALSIGGLMVAWWLVAAAMGEGAYNIARDFAASPLGLFMLFGWTFCLYYHLFNGIRHLMWDMVFLFRIENAYRAGYLVLLLTIISTAGTWYCAYSDHFERSRIERFMGDQPAEQQ